MKNIYLSLLLTFLTFLLSFQLLEGQVISTFPYFQNFENGSDWDTSGTNSSWEYGHPEKYNYHAFSGENIWGNRLNESFNYNQTSYLISPTFDFTNIANPVFSAKLFYSMNSRLALYYSTDNGNTWVKVQDNNTGWYWYDFHDYYAGYFWSGSTTDWIFVTHDIPEVAYLPNVKFAFMCSIGTTSGQIYIDDILFYDKKDTSLGVVNYNVTYDCDNSQTEVTVYNSGTVPISQFELSWSLDSGNTFSIPETINVTLDPRDTLIYTFLNPPDFSQGGDFNCVIKVNCLGEQLPADNTLSFTVHNYKISSLPSVQDFSDFQYFNNNGWYAENCDLGVDSITGDTNLIIDYQLLSPCIDLSSVQYPFLKFDIAYHSSTWSGSYFPTSEFYVKYIKANGMIKTLATEPIDHSGTWKTLIMPLPADFKELEFQPCYDITCSVDNISLFTPDYNDISVLNINPLKCYSHDSLQIQLVNLGGFPVTNIPVSYSIDSGNVFTTPEIITSTLYPGDTLTYTFNTPADFSALGYSNLVGKVEFPSDTIVFNNEKFKRYFAQPVISSFPFFDDLEGTNFWEIGGFDIPWELGTPDKNYLFTTYSGNNAWVTDLDSVLQAHYYGFGSIADGYLESPCFDFSSLNLPVFEMKVNYDLPFSYTTLYVKYSIDTGKTWNLLPAAVESENWIDGTWNGNPDEWITVKTKMPDLAGKNAVKFRIGINYDGNIDGIAFDDVQIYDAPPKDLSCRSIFTDNTCCGFTNNDSIHIVIQNLSSEPQWNIPITYSIDSGLTFIPQEIITDTINVYEIDTFTFATTADFSIPGDYFLVGKVNLPGDTIYLNNTASLTITPVPTITSFPYFQDFEGVQNWETGDNLSSWELGYPSDGFTFLQSDSNAWTTNLIVPTYSFDENSYLKSPCFDFSGLYHPIMELDCKFYLNSFHLLTLWSSTDEGETWQMVPGFYHHGITSGEDHFVLDLNYLNGTKKVMFMFSFYGNASLLYGDRVIIDNIYIHDYVPYDVHVHGITVADTTNFISGEPVTVTLINEGINDITNFNFKLSIDSGISFITETITDTLHCLDTLRYTFSSPFFFVSPGINYLIAVSELNGDTISSNDTAYATTFSQPYITNFPYFQNFEGNQYWFSSTGLNNWEINQTAPYSGMNDWYLYSNDNHTYDCFLESPIFDFSQANNPIISFYYESYIYSFNYLSNYVQLEYSLDTGNTWQLLVGDENFYNFPDSNFWTGITSWRKAFKLLTDLVGEPTVKFRFHFHKGLNSYSAKFKIDDIYINTRDSLDLGLIGFTNLNDDIFNDLDTIQVQVYNYGFVPVSNYALKYSLDSGLTYIEEVVHDTIFPNDTVTYSFTTPADFSLIHSYNVISLVSCSCDTVSFNDTIRKQVEVNPAFTFPYEQNFDETNYWHPINDTMWQCGTPELYFPTFTTSGDKAWVTGIDKNFTENSYYNSTLESTFFDLSSLQNPEVEFDLSYLISTNDHISLQFNNHDFNLNIGSWDVSQNYDWQHIKIPINYLPEDKTGKFRFIAYINNYFTVSYMRKGVGIDNFIVKDRDWSDLALLNIFVPELLTNNSTSINPSIKIVNTGGTDINNFTVSFSVDSGNTFSLPETITTTMHPDDTLLYTFSTGGDLSTLGWHKILAVVKSPVDSVALNDTVQLNVFTTTTVDTFPYFDNFENTQLWYSYKYPNAWQLGMPDKTNLNTVSSGNKGWVTNLTEIPFRNDSSILNSPAFDFTGLTAPLLRFYVDYYDNQDSLFLEYSTDTTHWNRISAFTGNSQANGHNFFATLINLSHQPFVRFRFLTETNANANHWTDPGFTIDDFEILENFPCDLGVMNCLPTEPYEVYQIDTMSLKIINYGSAPQSNFVVSYSIDSGLTFVSDTVTQVLQPADTMLYRFSVPVDFSVSGLYNIIFKVYMPADSNNTNDSIFEQLHSIKIYSTFPYFEDFETTQYDWHIENSYDTIVLVQDSSAPSGSYCMMAYSNESPYFNFTTIQNPTIGFWINYSFYYSSFYLTNNAYVQLLYSTDSGNTWQVAGNVGDDYNWYNSYTYTGGTYSSSGSVWVGKSNGFYNHDISPWMYVEHSFPDLAGEPLVLFKTKTRYPSYSFSMDDVKIFDKIHDLRLCSISPHFQRNNNTFSQDTIRVQIVNNGAVPESNFIVGYSIDNGNSYNTDIVTTTINPDDTLLYTFSSIPNFSSYNSFYLKGFVDVTNDENRNNDTINGIVVNQPIIETFPYSQNLDSIQHWYSYSDNLNYGIITKWEDYTKGYWIIDDPQNYGISFLQGQNAQVFNPQEPLFDHNYLVSPFFNLSNLTSPELDFDIFTSGNASVWLEKSTNDTDWVTYLYGFLGTHQSFSIQDTGLVKYRFVGSIHSLMDKIVIGNFKIHDHSPDLAIVDISPCFFTTGTQNMKIKVVNKCPFPQTNFTISYSTDSGYTYISESITDTIYYQDTVCYTFSTPANFITQEIYYFSGAVSLPADTLNDNDSLSYSAFVLNEGNPNLVTNFPYFQNFDTTNDWGTSSIDSIWYMGLPSGNVIDYAISGNNCWFTDLPDTLHWTNTIHPYPYYSYVYSPYFDFSQLQHIVLEMDVWWNNSFSSFMEYSTDSCQTWHILGTSANSNWYNSYSSWIGNTLTDWIHVKKVLIGLEGQSRVIFRISQRMPAINSSNMDGFAFDNILIHGPIPASFSSKKCQIAYSQCVPSSNDTIEIVIKNTGDEPHNDIPVSYSLDGGNTFITPEIITDTIYPDEEWTHKFSTLADLSAQGYHNIVGKVSYPQDTISVDDTISTIIYSYTQINNFPYFEDFEQAPLNWYADGNSSSWELSTPAGSIINSAHSGTKCWITHASGNYHNYEHSYVETPCFDFSGLTHPVFEMNAWWEIENSKDGVVLQYSTDNGNIWNNIQGNNTTNWYNDNSISALLAEGTETGWTGSTNGWITISTHLDLLAGEPAVKFRIVFLSDFANTDEGFAFDDVKIYDAYNLDIAVLDIPQFCLNCEGLKNVYATIKNLGLDTITGFVANWNIDNVPQVPFNFNGQLLPNTDTTINLGNYFFNNGNHIISVVTSSPNSLQDQNTGNDTLLSDINISNGQLDFTASTNQDTICGLYEDAVFYVNGNYPSYDFWSDFSGGTILETVTDSLVISTPSNLNQDISYWITTNLNDTLVLGQGFDFQQYGFMFDITPSHNIVLDSIGIFLNSYNYCNISTYFRQGTYSGYEADINSWIPVTNIQILGQGILNYTFISLNSLELDSGQTYGFYIACNHNDIKGQFNSNQFLNNDILISTGVALSGLFSSIFPNRTINAKLFYTKGSLCQSLFREPVSIFIDSCLVETDILSFTTAGQINSEIINYVNKTVYLTVSDTIDLATIIPTITVSYGATVSPASGVMQNFTSSPVIYTVTGIDGITQTIWYVTIENIPNKTINYDNINISVYPNPTNNKLWIEANLSGKLKIMDMTGKTVLKTNFSQKTEIDVERIQQGIYILSIENSKFSIKKKIIIE